MAAWLLVMTFRKAEAPEIIWNRVSQKGPGPALQWANEKELLLDSAVKRMSSDGLETSHVQPLPIPSRF